MKVRIKSGGDKDKKPTPAEIEAANKLARDISVRKNLLMGENIHVGDQIPKFYDARSGKELLPGDVQPPVGRLTNKVPLYVESLEWDSKANLPYYVDEKTGDLQYVQKDLFHAPRFSPNKNQSILNSVAKK